MAHTALLNKTRAELEAEGRAVFTENQNQFWMRGKAATISGKPDLIAIGENPVICDVKTGQPKAADSAQVMLYMYAVPLSVPKYKGMKFDGVVAYGDSQIHIPASAVDEIFKANLISLIKRVISDEPARRIPSTSECGFCSITLGDCPDRLEAQAEEDQQAVTEDF
jgi:hypothetical protein